MTSGAKHEFSHAYQHAAESPWGRAWTAYWGEKGAAGKIWGLVSLGEPLYADAWRIVHSKAFLAKVPEEIRFVDMGGGRRALDARDVPKYYKWAVPALRAELERNPRRGEELRAKETWWKKLGTDLVFSPWMWSKFVPARALVEYAGPKLARGVGVPIVRAIGRRPTAAKVLLTPAKRVAQIGDERLMYLLNRLQGSVGAIGGLKRAAVQRARIELRGYSGAELEEAALFAQRYETRAEYSVAVRLKQAARVSSNRVEELAEKWRRLSRWCFQQIPWGERTALPGTAEEVAAIARVQAAGGMTKAAKLPLRRGAYRLPGELKGVIKGGKLVDRVDQVTGKPVTVYRQRYYPVPGKARAAAGPMQKVAGRPGAWRPRTVARGVVARTAEEVEEDTARMIMGTPRYRVLSGIRKDLAEAIGRSQKLADPVQRTAALDVFTDLEKKLGPPGKDVILRGLELLDHWGVTVPKQAFTIYNFAWYVKNYIDTVWVKTLLAGIPVERLHSFRTRMPRDVFGAEVDVGVTWTREATGMDVGTSWFARQGNAIENTGRRAVFDDVYQREVRRGARAGMTTQRAHEKAYTAAMAKVAKVHFNYGDLSKLDEVMRRIVPFWMYERNQVRWIMETAAARPRLAYGAYKFFDVGEERGGPERRLPGMPTLMVQPAALLSPERYLKTICGVMSRDEGEQRRWRDAGVLGKVFLVGEQGGFYAHPFLEQGLGGLLKRTDLMKPTNWKAVAPLAGAIGKMLKVDLAYIGVWRTVFPGEEKAPRIEQLKRGYKRRVMQRHAFSILDGEEWSVARCEGYVTREMQVAGLCAFFGMFPKVREPKYDAMQELLAKRKDLSFREKEDFDAAHPEVQMWLNSLSMKQR